MNILKGKSDLISSSSAFEGETWREIVRHSALFVALIAVAACAPKTQELYARAQQALEKGDARAAIIDLKAMVQSEPMNAEARAMLGRALATGGNVGEAEIELKKARELGADTALTIVGDCQVLAAKEEFERVLADCGVTGAQGDALASMYTVRGQALQGLKRAPEAMEQFQAALKANSNRVDALIGLAIATADADGLPAGKAVLDKAPPAAKERVNYWVALGMLAADGGDLAGAEKAFARASELAVNSPEGIDRLQSLSALTQVQLKQGKVKEALDSSERLMKISPRNPQVQQLRGQVLAASGQLDEARELLEQAVAAMPENTQARTLLGLVNAQQGNLGQAEMHFSNVVAKDPTNLAAQKALAETRARLQSPEQALAAIRPTIEEGKADASMQVMAARLSLQVGDRQQALAYLAEAESMAAATQSAAVQFEIAGGYLTAGEVERAIAMLQSMPADSVPGHQREYLLMQAHLRNGDKDKAMAEANALLQRSGNDPVAKSMVAGVYASGGNLEASRAQYDEVLKQRPDDTEALLALARLDIAEGKAADAERNYRRVLELDSKNLAGATGLAALVGSRGNPVEAEKLLRKARTDHPDSIEVVLALAQFHMGANEFAKARAVIDEAAKKWPDSALLANARGLVQLGLKDFHGALESFRQAVRLAPAVPLYSLNLARGHLVNRDLDGALGVLDRLLRAEPGNLPALQLAAMACMEADRVEKATGYVERLRSLAPNAQTTYRLLGDLAMAQRLYREALENYRKANSMGTSRGLIIAMYQAGLRAGVAEPEKVLEDWLAAHPEDAGVAIELAQARQRVGRIDDAISLYEQALGKSPSNAVILNNLAVLYDETENPRAMETAERAYRLAGKEPAIQDTYGWMLFRDGQIAKAAPLLRDAAKALPDVAEVQYHYAAVLAKQGKSSEAVPLLKKSVNGQMPARAKAEAQALLRELAK